MSKSGPSEQEASDRVRAAGPSIRMDRKDLGLSREAVVWLSKENDMSFSLSTLRRAENSERVERHKLVSIARVLGRPVEPYIIRDALGEAPGLVPDLSGDWHAFYVEDNFDLQPYVCRERATLKQGPHGLAGFCRTQNSHDPRLEVLFNCRQYRNVFIGEIRVEGWAPPAGLSQFQLITSRGDDWMDGVTSWCDRDTGVIEWSRYIWVRSGSVDEEIFLRQAEENMTTELELFGLRKNPKLAD